MTAVAVQTSLFEHGRTFVQCCTVFLYSTFVSNCTTMPNFLKLVFYQFPKFCTVCTAPCTLAYKCAVQKYCTAQ